MKRFVSMTFLTFLVSGLAGLARADEKDAKAIVDKGITALGGEEKLTKAGAYSWKSKGTISFNGSDNEFTSQSTLQGLDHYRSEFDGKFGDTVSRVSRSSTAIRDGRSSTKTIESWTQMASSTKSTESTFKRFRRHLCN